MVWFNTKTPLLCNSMYPVFHGKHSVPLILRCISSEVVSPPGHHLLAPLESKIKTFKYWILFKSSCILAVFPKPDNTHLKIKTWHILRNSVVLMTKLNIDQLNLLGHLFDLIITKVTLWTLTEYHISLAIIITCIIWPLIYWNICCVFFSKEAYNFLFH